MYLFISTELVVAFSSDELLPFVCLVKSVSHFHSCRSALLGNVSLISRVFFFRCLNVPSHSLQTCKVSAEKPTIACEGFFLWSFFSHLLIQNSFFNFGFRWLYYRRSWKRSFWVEILVWPIISWTWIFGKFSAIIPLDKLSTLFFLSSCFLTLTMHFFSF